MNLLENVENTTHKKKLKDFFNQKYYELGLSTVPINDKKQPIVKWKLSQSELVKYDYSTAYGIAMVCGKVSGNIEVIDFDTKYDVTGTLMKRYRELVDSHSPNLLKKLVWQRSQSGGFHAIYRCEKIEGNLKLARRAALESEVGDKVKVLIETRGEGGYVAIHPTPNYSLISGTFDGVPCIDASERNILHLCARNFNEWVEPINNFSQNKFHTEGKSPFDDYDERGDVIGLLQKHGWQIVKEHANKIDVKRPGATTAISSGNFDKSRNWFSVFSTSTVFQPEKAYKPSAVFAILECGGNFSEAAKKLLDEGYGEKRKLNSDKKERPIKEKRVFQSVEVGDTTLEYVATPSEMDTDLIKWRTNTFEKGLSWGIPELDQYHLLKRGQFNIVNGRDNVGKSTLMWYLAMLSAMYHKWHWVVFSSENKFSTVKKRLIEFYWGEDIRQMNELKYKTAYDFVDKHFSIIKCVKIYTYMDLLNMTTNINAKKKVDGLLIDPYNSLIRKDEHGGRINVHDYDYEAASVMQVFMKSNNITSYINCHAISSALRLKDSDGQLAAPLKDDTEGGSKWGAKADDFLTAHRNVNNKTDYRKMYIHVRKVKETETGGRCTPFEEPVYIEMYGHYGFMSKSGIDPVKEYHNRNNQSKIEMPSATIKPNQNFSVSSQDKKETNESPYENDPLMP